MSTGRAGPEPALRQVGLGGAVILGLSAMLGTALFAVWTPAIALAESSLLIALALSAAVAALNANSSAQLARRFPVGGGVYSYAGRVLSRGWGITAGVGFVIGKSASCAAAALTIGAYAWPGHERAVAAAALVALLMVNLGGINRTTAAGAITVALVLAVVLPLALSGSLSDLGPASAGGFGPSKPGSVLAAAGLLFVAFAGYARVGTLGREIRDGSRNIPRAILIVFCIASAVYAVVAVATLRLGATVTLSAAPLRDLARALGWAPAGVALVTLAALVAAGGSALSLLAGMGRTVTAMADGGDAPALLGRRWATGVAGWAEVLAAGIAGAVVAVGGVGQALALSAITVLGYYGIAHLSWFRLSRSALPLLGLLGCLILSISLLAQAF